MFDVHLTQAPVCSEHCGCIVITVSEGRELSESARRVDRALDSLVSLLLDRGTVSGRHGQVLTLPLVDNNKADYLIVVGAGPNEKKSARAYREIITAACNALAGIAIKNAALYLTEVEVVEKSEQWKIRQQTEAIGEAFYRINSLKTQSGQQRRFEPPEKITLSGPATCHTAVAQGLAVAEGIKKCRDLANLPANICTPTYLARQARELATEHETLSTLVLGEEEMRKLGMNVLLSVGAGSAQPSQLAVMHYRGGAQGEQPHVLLGKGITFDTGGVYLKNRDGMKRMKYDMGGAAAVIGAMVAVARLGLALNVIGVIACAENMPGSRATKPSDVVTSMSGKTVEILNTDAEGRLVLCDALTYIERFDPASVVDTATLTGACVVALGRHYSGLFANDDALANKLLAAGRESLDQAWQLPLAPEEMRQLDTEFADIANMGDGTAASVVAALFLSRFAAAYPWAHLDVSGTAKRVTPNVAATGRPVPLLVQYLINLDEKTDSSTHGASL